MTAMGELVGVTCDRDVHGQPCYLWTGHYGLCLSDGHDRFCRDCGDCACQPSFDCWVEEPGENEMVAVRLPRHTLTDDARRHTAGWRDA